MTYFSEHAIPTALIDLRNKHGYVNQVIQYCETAYLTQDKHEIETQTKEYVADALGAVVKDIELITTNLTNFLDIQMDALEALTPQLDLVKNKIAQTKASHAQHRLTMTRREVEMKIPEQKKEALKDGEQSLNSKKLPAYERKPLAERMAALDGVGHSLG
ncbi:hypothetical protein ScalyP_jg1565 [Parmales sp. scaly parma]|nr:hypothetical protein ScalyP_jg1565 [Parmales sp. scaly parma]